jgi:co-chaperonin GroES (HSP10)
MPDQTDVLRQLKTKLHNLKELGKGVRVSRVRGPRVLVKTVIPHTELDEYKSKGLVIPEAHEKEYIPLPTTGIVLGFGPDVSDLKEGDMVMFAKLSGMDFTINEQDLRLIHEKEIMAVLEDTDGSVMPVKDAL